VNGITEDIQETRLKYLSRVSTEQMKNEFAVIEKETETTVINVYSKYMTT
jgi:hypothetical protein